MGSFFTDILSFQHETAVFDVNPHQLRFVYNTYRFTTLEEIKEFEPELVINAVTVKYTLDAFRKILPVLPKDCIISDIASVKTGLKKFYEESGFRYVSSHPMFGPTFASLSNLSSENAIIISEGDHLGKIFFKDLYQTLRLNRTDQVDRRPDLRRQLAGGRWIKDRIEPQIVSANKRLGRRRKVTFALGDKDASGSRGNLAGVAVELMGHQAPQCAGNVRARKRMVGAR